MEKVALLYHHYCNSGVREHEGHKCIGQERLPWTRRHLFYITRNICFRVNSAPPSLADAFALDVVAF